MKSQEIQEKIDFSNLFTLDEIKEYKQQLEREHKFQLILDEDEDKPKIRCQKSKTAYCKFSIKFKKLAYKSTTIQIDQKDYYEQIKKPCTKHQHVQKDQDKYKKISPNGQDDNTYDRQEDLISQYNLAQKKKYLIFHLHEILESHPKIASYNPQMGLWAIIDQSKKPKFFRDQMVDFFNRIQDKLQLHQLNKKLNNTVSKYKKHSLFYNKTIQKSKMSYGSLSLSQELVINQQENQHQQEQELKYLEYTQDNSFEYDQMFTQEQQVRFQENTMQTIINEIKINNEQMEYDYLGQEQENIAMLSPQYSTFSQTANDIQETQLELFPTESQLISQGQNKLNQQENAENYPTQNISSKETTINAQSLFPLIGFLGQKNLCL